MANIESKNLNGIKDDNISFKRVSDLFEKLKGYFYANNICKQDFINLSTNENFLSSLIRISNPSLQGGYSYNKLASSNDTDNVIGKELKDIANKIAKSMFECEVFNFDVCSSIKAQQSILLGVCDYGDSILHFKRSKYEDSSLEELAKKFPIKIYHIPTHEKSLEINMSELESLIKEHPEIKLIMLDQTVKLREESLMALRNIVPDNVIISYDCSDSAGLIASGILPQPSLMGVDIIYGCTNTTIPGPQKGFIGFKDANNPYYESISDWCKLYLQSSSHNEQIVPLLLSLYEMKVFGREYCMQMVDNAKAFAKELYNEGFNVFGENFGFTETNQVYIVIGSLQKTLDCRKNILLRAGIYVDIVEIPGESEVFGLKLGTQAMTRRGFTALEFKEIARILGKLILKDENPENIKFEVKAFLEKYPMFPLKFSFDKFLNEDLVKELISEVLR